MFSKLSRIVLLVVVQFFPVQNVSAQEESVELFGYYEPLFSYSRVNGKNLQLQSNKLRIDLSGSVSERIEFGANFDLITYHGTSQYNMVDFLPESIRNDVAYGTESMYGIGFEDRYFLDNAFIKVAFDKLDITVGKQQLSFGSGYFLNPADIFNDKDIFDPTYEQPGVNAIRFDYQFSDKYSISAVYFPEEKFESSAVYINFKGQISHFDFGFSFAEFEKIISDYYSFSFLPNQKRMYGFDFSGELFGLGIHGEGAFFEPEHGKDHSEILTGIDYTFDSGMYVLIEHFYNGLGEKSYEEYNLNDWMRNFSYETKSLSRNQIFGYGSYPATDLTMLGCSTIISTCDGSFALVPQIDYNFEENLDVSLFLNLLFGRKVRHFQIIKEPVVLSVLDIISRTQFSSILFFRDKIEFC